MRRCHLVFHCGCKQIVCSISSLSTQDRETALVQFWDWTRQESCQRKSPSLYVWLWQHICFIWLLLVYRRKTFSRSCQAAMKMWIFGKFCSPAFGCCTRTWQPILKWFLKSISFASKKMHKMTFNIFIEQLRRDLGTYKNEANTS